MTLKEKAEQLAGLINRSAPAILNEQELASYAEFVDFELFLMKDKARTQWELIHSARLADPVYRAEITRRHDEFWKKQAQEVRNQEQQTRNDNFCAEGARRQTAKGEATRARIKDECERLRWLGKPGPLSGIIARTLKIPQRTVSIHLKALGLGR
jgi:hypothetical protein